MTMTQDIFIELGAISFVALIVSGLMTKLKQPLIIGYIISGIILGPKILNITKSSDSISSFAQMGVILLLFMVGISLSPEIIKKVGKVSVVTGLGQIIFTSAFGMLISKMLGFNLVSSFYIAVALTFSSTIIIMKIISDKDDIDSLYGRIAVGFLIVQDLVAMMFLLITTSIAGNKSGVADFDTVLMLMLVTVVSFVVFIIGRYLLPKLMIISAQSQEFLLLFSIGWCILVAAIFHFIGFSMEIGALIAGVALADSPFKFEISSKLKPLRDYFIFMFFILLGSNMVFGNITEMIVPVVVYSLFILIGNPIIVMVLMGLLGYTKKNSFLAGLTVAQISEFSLIYIALGVKVGHIPEEILPLVTVVGLITIAGSTYMMLFSDKLYKIFQPYLSIFEKRGHKVDNLGIYEDGDFDVILFGYKNLGKNIEESLIKMNSKYLIVDYNPEIIKHLINDGKYSRYGDVSDIELLDELNLCRAKMIISTVKDFAANLLMLERVREKNIKNIIINIATNEEEAIQLYEKGSSYVVLPHNITGIHTAKTIESYGFDINKYIIDKSKEKKRLVYGDA